MAARKLFTNNTPHALAVTLVIRASHDPRNVAGTKDLQLGPGDSQWQEYGNDVDIYLNGIKVVAQAGESVIAQQDIVIMRGSPLDDALNTRNGVDFGFANGQLVLSTRQVN